jgi:tetratricopeptide (TPR) repeat protein
MQKTASPRFVGHLVLSLLGSSFLILTVVPAIAQHGGNTHPVTPPPQAPTSVRSATNPIDQNRLLMRGNNQPPSSKISKEDNCFLPPLNGLHSASVGIADLEIPEKAQRERDDGCGALRNNKIVEAEIQFRKAVKLWPKYWAAWIVLGQVLEAQQKTKEAHDACSQPLTTDSNYLPAYLCLADISARSEIWNEVLRLSARALELDPTTDAVAYDYNAAANFNLHNLPEAEKSALRAADIDKNNSDPRVHFLLAQIYEAKGDRAAEAAQLREYLKYASDPSDVKMVKQYLSDLEKNTK